MAKPGRNLPAASVRKGTSRRPAGKGGSGLSVAPFDANDTLLTPRELQCLRLLAEGLRSEQIAYELKVARVTVDFHIANAKTKLRAITREQAVARAIRGGYLEN